MTWFTVSVGSVAALGAWCILRVRREYMRRDRLSPVSIGAVWVLYVSHFAVTAAAAATSLWLVPVNKTIMLVGGLVLASCGVTLLVGGIVSLGSLRRMSGMDTGALVTTGAYQWSRNPQNVGWALFLMGIALVGRSALAVGMAAVFWAAFRAYVPAEEKFLERILGDEYRDYKASSHRCLGRPGTPSV